MQRRQFISISGAAAALSVLPSCVTQQQRQTMYGLIGKMIATEGNRDTLINILAEGTRDMPGCISYIIAKDTSDPDVIWVTEVWESQEKHQASLQIPAVQEAIQRGRPMIAGFGDRFETTPVAGLGV